VGQGEPLLHPNFIEFLKIAKGNDIVCHLTTNGSLLNEKIMNEIIDEGLDSIKFSFQGVNCEGYRTLRQKDNFEKLISTIEELYKLRGEREKPYITVATSVTNETEEQIQKFKDRCSAFCDKVEVGITTLEFIDLDKIKNDETKQALQKLREHQNRIKKRYKCCNQVFDVITVRWNGDISACCADNDGIMTLGNIYEKSILDCWNSPLQNHYRKILADCRYDDLELCKNCYDVMGYMS
jgi:radical SAM protein with 4Fe4S-binding SPASM domain